MSILLSMRTNELRSNQRLLATLSQSMAASASRFTVESSNKTWSYSEIAATKMSMLTFSKQWILCDQWPTTDQRSCAHL